MFALGRPKLSVSHYSHQTWPIQRPHTLSFSDVLLRSTVLTAPLSAASDPQDSKAPRKGPWESPHGDSSGAQPLLQMLCVHLTVFLDSKDMEK